MSKVWEVTPETLKSKEWGEALALKVPLLCKTVSTVNGTSGKEQIAQYFTVNRTDERKNALPHMRFELAWSHRLNGSDPEVVDEAFAEVIKTFNEDEFDYRIPEESMDKFDPIKHFANSQVTLSNDHRFNLVPIGLDAKLPVVQINIEQSKAPRYFFQIDPNPHMPADDDSSKKLIRRFKLVGTKAPTYIT